MEKFICFIAKQQFYYMLAKNNRINPHQEHDTDTYFSTFNKQPESPLHDHSIFKAIQQNDVSYIVDKHHEKTSQFVQKYREEEDLMLAILQLRKKYDQEKDKTTKIETNIERLEEVKLLLLVQEGKFKREEEQLKNNFLFTEEHQKKIDSEAEYAEFFRDIRLNMQDTLKNDILYYRKACFEHNIALTRTKTQLREASQRAHNKKHLSSKCKLVLNSLQDTVRLVQGQRFGHLQQIKTMLYRKMQNTQLKKNRQTFLMQSLRTAQIQKLPEEVQITKTLYGQLLVRKILRSKMNRMMQQNKDIQNCFNIIKKSTRISSIHEFIDEYLGREKKYGDLLQKIQRSQVKIDHYKQQTKQLQQQYLQLQNQSLSLQNIFDSKYQHDLKELKTEKMFNKYNDELRFIEELRVVLRRWSIKNLLKFRNIDDKINDEELTERFRIQMERFSLKDGVMKMLKLLNKTIEDIDIIEKSKNQEKKEAKSQLSTNRSEDKINLNTMRSEAVLNKDISRRNFRVKTMVQADEILQENDLEYDDGSEYDFLRHNRRVVKKNNIKLVRARIKTKPY